jgi:hypothetical protein
MSTTSGYSFNNMSHMNSDLTDESQYNLQNSKYAGYMLSNYFQTTVTDQQIQFVSKQPTMNVNAVNGGSSVGGKVIDIDTALIMKKEQERSVEKVQLMARPFATVPYLGKGSCDPTLESQLLQGEVVSDKKSTSTVMSQSFMGYTLYPMDSKMEEHVKNPGNSVEEVALNGWVRGGAATREMSNDQILSKSNRPMDSSY